MLELTPISKHPPSVKYGAGLEKFLPMDLTILQQSSTLLNQDKTEDYLVKVPQRKLH